MTDLIDRQALIKRLKVWDTPDVTDKMLYNFALNRALEMPTIEAVPIKHGMWIGINKNKYNDDEATCSICGATIASDYSNPSWWDYCPNCGARMDDQIGEDKSHPFAESVMMGMDEVEE